MIAVAAPSSDCLAAIAKLTSARPEAILMRRLGAVAGLCDEPTRWLVGKLAHASLCARSREEQHKYRTGALPMTEWGRFLSAAATEDRADDAKMHRDDYTTSRDRGI